MKTAKTSHLDEAALLRHAAADQSRADSAVTQKHLARCAPCHKRLDTFRRIDAGLTAIGTAERRKMKKAIDAHNVAEHGPSLERIFSEGREAERAAEEILRAARGDEGLAAALRDLGGLRKREMALLLAARNGTQLVGIDPERARRLAVVVRGDVLAGKRATSSGSGSAITREILAETFLLEARALSQTYRGRDAQAAVLQARKLLRGVAGCQSRLGVCDFQEAEAVLICWEHDAAERLIGKALRAFAKYGPDDLTPKAWAVKGTIRANRGNHRAALPFFRRAIANYDERRDANAVVATLNNWANSLAQLGRLDEARALYARSMRVALQNGMASHVRLIRTGLAEIDFLNGRYSRALHAFGGLSAEFAVIGSTMDVLFSGLYVAECLGRLDRFNEMAAQIEAMRRIRRETPFGASPALGELFVCLDQGTIDADLVKHVREYLQDVGRGVKRVYRALRRA